LLVLVTVVFTNVQVYRGVDVVDSALMLLKMSLMLVNAVDDVVDDIVESIVVTLTA